MPTNELRPTPSADVIRRFEFATVRRGYDPDQVRDYLSMAAGRIDALEKELQAAQAALKTAEQRAAAPTAPTAGEVPDPYEAFAKRFAGLLGTADREAQRLVEEAKAESARILDESRMEADRIRVDAQDRAEEARAEGRAVLEEARAEAERALSSLATRRQQLVDQLQAMQSRLISAAHDLDVVIEEEPEDFTATIAEIQSLGEEVVTEEPDAEAPDRDEPVPPAVSGSEAETPDPRYEDLWVSSETDAVEMPDLASIEFDFGEDHAEE
jgi:DivIVA domain-containing protein